MGWKCGTQREKFIQGFAGEICRYDATFYETGRRWEDNTRLDLQAIVCEGADWIHLAQDRDKRTDAVNKVNEPSGTSKCGGLLHQLSYH
jgi:hypothetical protein